MKLHVSLLEKFVALPTVKTDELRQLLCDVRLEVKGVEGDGQDAIFTIETLANRGDHVYTLGAAREISARTLSAVKIPALAENLSDRKTSIPVRKLTDKCLRYGLLEMTLPDVMPLRPEIAALLANPDPTRHSIVHLLNYIWMEIGQPMHAFDRDKVEGEVVIDAISAEAQVEALDGKTYKLAPGTIVIKDKQKIIAVAGVIGCANSMVTPETKRVLIESACFDPVSVRLSARAMGISTDASYTFERGADIESVLLGLKRVSYLAAGAGGAVRDAAGAHVVGFTYIEGDGSEKRKVALKLDSVRKNMNLPRLDPKEISARLKYLGYGVELNAEGKVFSVVVPSWRLWDVRNEEDVVEDFICAMGLNKVKLELPPLDYDQPEPHDEDVFLKTIEPVLVGNGFFEVITQGFYSADEVALLEETQPGLAAKHVALKDSVEKSYSHMKYTNLFHLAKLAERNHRQGLLSLKVYEFGRLFELPASAATGEKAKKSKYEYERDVLSIATSGRWYEHEWQKPESLSEQLMLFKGVLEDILLALGIKPMVIASQSPLFHPGYQACFKVGREVLGQFGVVHPALKKRLDLRQDVIYAEFNADVLIAQTKAIELAPSWNFPSVRRDLTLKIPERSLAAEVNSHIDALKPENLVAITVVDNFKKADENFRRVSYRITFRNQERTLSSAEVDASMQKILETLKEKHQIELAP